MESRLKGTSSNDLNKLMNLEFKSAYIYEVLGIKCDIKGYFKLRDYFYSQKEEELLHYTKIRNYLLDRNCVPQLDTNLKEITCDCEDYLSILELALKHEIYVEESWLQAKERFKISNDITSCEFAHWFILEQVEEIAKFNDYIATFKSDNILGRILTDNIL